MPRYQHALRSRILRDDFAVDPLLPVDPAMTPVDPSLDTGPVVSDVIAVEPVTKRYRATVTRTVTETALVEFDAPETADLYTMAEELLPQIPPEAWVESPADSWGYIDRIEPLETVADPAAPEALLEDDVDLEGDDVEEPEVAAGRSRRRRSGRGVRLVAYRRNPKSRVRRAVRMPASEALVAIEEVQGQFDTIVSSADMTTVEGITAYIAQLDALAVELNSIGIDDDGGTGESAIAEEAGFALLATIEDAMFAADEAAATLQPAAEPALDPVY